MDICVDRVTYFGINEEDEAEGEDDGEDADQDGYCRLQREGGVWLTCLRCALRGARKEVEEDDQKR